MVVPTQFSIQRASPFSAPGDVHRASSTGENFQCHTFTIDHPQTRQSAVTAKSNMAAYATDTPSIRHGVPYRRRNVEASHDTALQAAPNGRMRLNASLSDGQVVCAPIRANRLYPGHHSCPGHRQNWHFPLGTAFITWN